MKIRLITMSLGNLLKSKILQLKIPINQDTLIAIMIITAVEILEILRIILRVQINLTMRKRRMNIQLLEDKAMPNKIMTQEIKILEKTVM